MRWSDRWLFRVVTWWHVGVGIQGRYTIALGDAISRIVEAELGRPLEVAEFRRVTDRLVAWADARGTDELIDARAIYTFLTTEPWRTAMSEDLA
jgi:hypothetical protein